jgi:hexokinase
MMPSFVQQLPTGKEVGTCLSMELGGTHLRITQLTMDGNINNRIVQQREYKLHNEIISTTGQKLFEFAAQKLREFCTEHGLLKQKLTLGLLFNFPMEQTSLSSAKLIRWTNGFNATGVVGKDVIPLLQSEIDKYEDLLINVNAIVNESVGTQLATAFMNGGHCDMGIILNTGTNAAYMERNTNILALNTTHMQCDSEVVYFRVYIVITECAYAEYDNQH